MKWLSVFVIIVALAGCAPVVGSPPTFEAAWKGDTITLLTSHGPVYFAAPRSSASDQVETDVLIVQRNGHWYIWADGYQDEIFIKEWGGWTIEAEQWQNEIYPITSK